MKKSKRNKKILAAGVIFLHLFTQTVPVSFADGDTLPPVINLQEGTATAFGDIVIPEGQRLAVNILDALGQVCPSCRAIMEANSFVNQGFFDITGFLALIAPVIINEGSITTTGGLILSNLGIDQQAFYNGMAELQKSGINPADSYILNKGEIDAMTGKIIALIGANGGVHNFGSIRAEGGAIAMIAGDKVSFPLTRDGVFEVSVEGLTGLKGQVFDSKGTPVETDGLITNSGLLQANGGFVLLSAAAREQMLDKMINVTGTIEAKSLEEKDGEIILSGDEGNVAISGNLNASAAENGARGGKINITGNDIEILDGAKIETLGYGLNSDGGTIFVMGRGTSALNAGSLLDASAGTSGDGGFIEFSSKSNVELAGGVMLAEARDGNAGNILIDPTDLVISTNQFTGGANVTYQADDSITVNPGIIISSRKIAVGGDHLTANSTGNSGNITFEAPEILVGSGAKILAHATAGFTAGDIKFDARDIGGLISLISPYTWADTSIVIDNATIKGKDITFSAKSDAGRVFSDTSDAVEQVIDVLDSVTTFAGVAISDAEASIEVKSGSFIEGSNVSFFSEAKSDAQVKTITTAVGVAYGQSDATSNIVLQSGSTVKATGNLDISSNASGNLDILAMAANLGQGRGSTVDFAVAVGRVDVDSTAEVKSGATIEAGGTNKVGAFAAKRQNVTASAGAYEDGTVGLSAAISLGEIDANSLMDGTMKSGGDAEITSAIIAHKDDVQATASVGSDPVTGAVIKGANAVLDKVTGFSGSKTPSTASSAGGAKAGISAAFAYGESDNTSLARVGESAVVESGGKVNVLSEVTSTVETSALASIDPISGTDPKVAVAGAVVIGDFTNSSSAIIENNAEVDAKNDITVKSRTYNPYEIQWHEIENVGDVVDKLNGNIGIQNGFFTSWAQSQGKGSEIGVAGSVNFFSMDNTSLALIDEGAKINQDTNFRTQNQGVLVEALNDISTLNLSGVFGLKGIGVGGGKAGLGAAYIDIDYDSNVTAKIGKGVQLYAEDLEVNADSLTRNIAISEAGGTAEKYAVDGSFSFLNTEAHVLAQIEDGSTIVTDNGDVDSTGDTIRVTAHDKSEIYTGSGGIAKGGNVGVGASVSINEVKRETRAIIGNKANETNDTGSVKSEGAIAVEAVNDGKILSASLAAAVQDQSSSSAPGTFGIAISGDVAFNTIEDDTEAVIRDANITKATDVSLLAKNDSDIKSFAGSVAISTSQSTSFLSGGIAGAYVKNEINNEADATIDNSIIDMSEDLDVIAKTEGEILAITASGSGAAKRAVAGAVSTNVIADSTRATIRNNSDINGSDTATIKASDDSNIFSVAGSIGFSTGKSGSGSGSATNNINNVIRARVEDSDLSASVKTDILASTDSDIETYSAALGADIQGSASGSSTSKNDMDSTIEAFVKGKKTDGIESTGDVTISAADNSDLLAVGGNLALNGGTDSGKGKTLAFNEINNEVNAFVTSGTNGGGAKITSTGGKIAVKSDSTSEFSAIGVGGVGSGGTALALNVMKNDLSNDLRAYVKDNSSLKADGDITIEAKDSATLKVLAGVVTGGGKNSVGETLAFNEIDNGLQAYIEGSGVNSTNGTISLKTGSTSSIQALSATGTLAGGTASLAGAESINRITNTYDSHIKSTSNVNANKIEVKADDSSTIESLAGALTIGSKGSAGAGVSTNDITNSIAAYVDLVDMKADTNGIDISAKSAATIKNISAGGAGAGSYSAGGSVSLNDIDNTITAYADSSTVEAPGDVNVSAVDNSTIESLAGTVTGAGTASIGAAIATNEISNDVKAYGRLATLKSTSENVNISAASTNTIKSISAGVSGAGTAAITGAVSLNTIGGETSAKSTNTTLNASKGVSLSATETSTIRSISGAAGGAGTAGIGGGAAYNELSNTVVASIDGGTITATNDSVLVKALSTGTVDTISAGGAAGGTGGVAGSVSINAIGKTIEAFIKGATVTANDSIAVVADMANSYTVYGGTFSAGGTVGIGGTVVISTLANIVKSYITNGANVTAKGNDTITVPKADTTNGTESIRGLAVRADVNEDLDIFSANATGGGKVGVAATVSNTVSEDNVQAYVDGSTIGSTDANSQQGASVKASNNTDVAVKAGGLTIGGAAGAGATNDNVIIQNTTKAYLNNTTANVKSGGLTVAGTTQEKVDQKIVSGAIGSGLGLAGSVGIIDLKSTNESYVQGGTVNSDGDLKVLAVNTADIDQTAGTVSIGGTAGVGGTILVNSIGNTTTARLTNAATNAKGTTEVNAKATNTIDSYAATGALSGYAGAAGTVTINTIETTTQALMNEVSGGNLQVNQDSAYDNSGQNVTVKSEDISSITPRLGNVSSANTGAVGASVDISTIKNTVTASIGSGTLVSAANEVLVSAVSTKTIDTIVVAFSGALAGGVAGAVSIANIGSALSGDGNTAAASTKTVVNTEISQSPVSDAAGTSNTAVTAANKVNSKTSTLSVSDELTTGVSVTNSTTASIGSSAVVDAGKNIKVLATENTRVDNTVGAAAGGFLGAGGSVALTGINSRTNAVIGDSAELEAGDNVEVIATGKVNDSDAETKTGTAGVISLGAAVSILKSDNDVTAAIGNSVKVKKADDVRVTADMTSDVRSYGFGASAGAAAAGVVYTETQETGTVDAKIGNNGTIGGTGAAPAVANVYVTGKSNVTVQAESTAATAGIISGNGSVANATSNPNTNASIGTGAVVKTTNDVIVDANTLSRAIANAQGTSVGSGVSAGLSLAQAFSSGNISSFIGDSSNVTAGRDITFKSSFNRNADGSGLLDAEKAVARASTGGNLVGAASANALTTGNVSTWSTVGSSDTLKAGRSTNITSNNYHAAYAQSDASSTGGVLAAGSTYGKVNLTSSAASTVGSSSNVESVDDTNITSLSQSFAKTQVNGGSGKSITDALKDLISGNIVGFFTGGGLGSLLSFGGAVSEVTVDNTATSTVGSSATVKAGDELNVKADGIVDVDTFTKMVSKGTLLVAAMAATDVFVDSDAVVNVNSGAKVEGKKVSLLALNKMDLKAYAEAVSQVTVINAIASAMSRLRVGSSGDKSNAQVNIGANAEIKGTDFVNIDAQNIQKSANLLSKAKAFADGGVAAIANTLADSTVEAASSANSTSGSKIETGDLTVHAESTMTVDRIAESKAETVTKKIVEVVKQVVKEVCTWLPWPLDDLCDYVVEEVIELVEVFTLSIENEKTGGSGLVTSDSINFNSQVRNVGGESRTLIVNIDGSTSGNLGATQDADNVYVNDVTNNAKSKVRFYVPKGNLSGSSQLIFSKVLENVKIENNSNKNLVVGKVNMISDNGGEPDAVYNYKTGTKYETVSTIQSSKLEIDNNGTGDVKFTQSIQNNLADFDFYNKGGDILAASDSVAFDGYHFNLRADNGDLGSSSQRLNFNLFKAKTSPDGLTANTNDASLSAFSYGDMYLKIDSSNTEFVNYNAANASVNGIKIGDLNSFGSIDVKLEKGTLFSFYDDPNCTTCNDLDVNDVSTFYNVKNVTARENIKFDAASGATLTLDGTMTSGLKDITFDIDANGNVSGNTYNHELTRSGGTIILKDIIHSGGDINIQGSLNGTGTLKALDGYSQITVNNASGQDVEIGDFNVLNRINKNITVNSDTNVTSNEYGSVQVSTYGNTSGGITVNNTAAGSDIILSGNLENSTGLTSLTTAQGSILNTGTAQLLQGNGITLSAVNGQIGQGADGIKTDLKGGVLNAAAGNDVKITETTGDMDVQTVTSTNGNVTLKTNAGNMNVGAVNAANGQANLTSSGSITDSGDNGFGENLGAESDITARSAVLQAGSGIGTASDGIETRLTGFGGGNNHGRLEAGGGTGGVYVSNKGSNGFGLILGGIGTLAKGVSAIGGNIAIYSNSPLVVNSDVEDTGGGDILLSANGSTAADDLTLNANVTASGGNGNVVLSAGDTIALNNNKVVSAAGNGNIQLLAGEDFADGTIDQDGNTGSTGGEIIMQDGTRVVAANGTITADAASDILVSSLETANNGNSALTVNARAGAISDGGDAYTDLITGTSGQAILRAVNGIGSGNGLETSIGNLDLINSGFGDVYIGEVASGGALGINRAFQQSSGDMVIFTNNGALTVNAGQNGASTVNGLLQLTAFAGGDLNINDTLTSTAGNISLAAFSTANDVKFSAEGDVTSDSGLIGILSAKDVIMDDGAIVKTTSGTIGISADRNVAVSSLQTGSNADNAIVVNALGAVTDNGDTDLDFITGTNGQLNIAAGNGIGSGNALETSVGHLDIFNDFTGNVEITEVAAGGNLGINRIDQQGAGSVTVRTLDGTLTVNAGQNGVIAKAGEVTLSANGAFSNDDLILNDTVSTTSGKINLDSTSNDVIFSSEGDVTSDSGEIEVSAARDIALAGGAVHQTGSGDLDYDAGRDITMGALAQTKTNSGFAAFDAGRDITQTDTALTSSGTGNVEWNAGRNIAIASIQNTSNSNSAVVLNAGGAVSDNGDTDLDVVTGASGQLVINASNGIGSGNALETSTGNLDLINNGPNNIEITEVASGGALGINRVDQQGSGTVVIRTDDGTLTVNANQSGVLAKAGEVTLSANGAGSNDDLIVNDTVTTTSGKINLDSNSRDVVFSSEGDVTSASGEVEVFAVRDMTQVDGAVVNAGSGNIDVDAGRNAAVASLQTTNNSNDAVNINAGGAVSDNGDTDLDVVTGTDGQLVINAVTGVGSSNALETSVGHLNLTNATSGNINIDEVASGGNLGINKVDQQGAGTVTVRALDGTLTVNAGQSGVSATSGEVTLSAEGTNNDDNVVVNDTVVTDSGKINIDSLNNDVLFSAEGDVTSNSGKVEVTATRDIIQDDGAVINSGLGNIDLLAGRDIALASLQTISAATDAVLINAVSGEVRDNGDTDSDIVAQNGTTTIRANTGIGSLNALDTRMANVSAITDSGNVQIDNTGALNVVTANGVSGISITDSADLNAGEFITVRTFSPLTVTAGSPVVNNAGGDVTLNALGNLAADDLTLNADVITVGGDGNILLTAGDTFTISGGIKVSAAGNGNVTVASGEDFTDGLINQDGNTGVGGGDVIMDGTAQFLTEAGNVTVDAGDDFFVGVINTDSDNDGNIGDAFATTRAGSILDSNGPDMNITADELTLDSAGSIGTANDPIETTVRVLNALSVGSMFFFNVGSITANLRSLQGSIGLQATGNIFLAGVYAQNGTVFLQSGGSILSSMGGGIAVAANTVITLIANGTIGGASAPVVFNLANPGNVFVSAVGGTSEGLSVNMTGNVGPSSFEFLNLPPGLILLNGAAVGGGTFSLMASGVSNGLYSSVFPQPTQGSGIIDGRFAADFPGAFNADNFSYNAPQDIDTSALENIQMPVFELPTVVPVPQESTAKTTVVEEAEEEEKKDEEPVQGENPPAVVPVPQDAQPSDAEIIEPISAENQ